MMLEFTGRRGVVQVNTTETPRVATKKARQSSHQATIRKEAAIIEKLIQHNISFVPQICDTTSESFSYQRIEGEPFEKIFHTLPLAEQQQLIHEFLNKAHQLDLLGIVHGELDNPTSNVLINISLFNQKKSCLFFIDFERGYRQDFSGKNLRHVMQWLQRQGYISIAQCKAWGSCSATQLYDILLKHMQSHVSQNKKIMSPHMLFFLLIGILLSIDLITKRLFYDLRVGETTRLLTPLLNTGVGRSIPLPRTVTITLAVLFTGVGVWRAYRKQQFPLWAVFFVAGAWGNAYDRIIYAGVRDFIDVHRRPVFNGADIFLTLACLMLILYPNFSVGTMHIFGKK